VFSRPNWGYSAGRNDGDEHAAQSCNLLANSWRIMINMPTTINLTLALLDNAANSNWD
jgi:hypothetical protein